jgi:hypothetical protein
MAGSDSELSVLLPIIVVETQKEKNNIIKEVEDMVKKELEKNQMMNVIEVVNILFGIHSSEGKNPYYRYE